MNRRRQDEDRPSAVLPEDAVTPAPAVDPAPGTATPVYQDPTDSPTTPATAASAVSAVSAASPADPGAPTAAPAADSCSPGDGPGSDSAADPAADSAADPAGPESAGVPAPDVATLAAPLRARLAEVCSEAVGALPFGDLPQPLRPIARFAPAKRARAGEAALLTAFANNAAFRVQVREWAAHQRPELLRVTAADALTCATAAILDGHPAATHLADLVALRAADAARRAERDAAVATAERLRTDLDAATAKVTGADTDADRRATESAAEADRLRGRLREQGTRLRVARDEADAANAALAALRAETELEVKRVEAERDAERTRADAERDRARSAEQAAAIAKQSAREARQADETRLALLVETIEGAAAGLRGELTLGASTGLRPADSLARARNAAVGSRMVRDTGALDALLRLPAAHLIVDGYNVTKTGYPELSLADQRDRLARQLAALAARTNAEVTVVFDGAGVVAHTTWPRGVRVQFSAPGVLADDVIRDLVAVEPSGRPLIVATSDNAVVESVRADGAHTVPSAVLVKRLMRV